MTLEESIKELKSIRIDLITAETSEWMSEKEKRYVDACDMAIEALEQERKTGHWEEQEVGNLLLQVCDQCGFCYPLIRIGSYFDYCPGCGTKMESEVKE